jgi:hypothetical protein
VWKYHTNQCSNSNTKHIYRNIGTMVVRQNSGYWKVMCGYIKNRGCWPARISTWHSWRTAFTFCMWKINGFPFGKWSISCKWWVFHIYVSLQERYYEKNIIEYLFMFIAN